MLETDIAVIGGGPAGAAAALTLRRYTSHSVVIVERDAYQHPRVGETVSSAIGPLLDYLGARECLRGGDVVESHANAASWGNDRLIVRDHVLTGRGSGWHLNRRLFDLSLADVARKAGATTFRNTRIRSAIPADDRGWLLSVDGENNTLIHAAEVIDASGRTISFARFAGAMKDSIDHLVGIVAYFRGLDCQSTDHTTLIEAEECGWWYGALLPHGVAVVSFMTDIFEAKKLGVKKWHAFYERLLQTRYISGFLANADPQEHLYIHSASSHRLRPVIGPRWVAVGDAAASFDPLSSLGIGHALSSGIQGARIVDARMEGDHELADAFTFDVARFADEFLERRSAIYQTEQRWPQSEFWRSRHKHNPSQHDDSIQWPKAIANDGLFGAFIKR